jgi:hypothetical protein
MFFPPIPALHPTHVFPSNRSSSSDRCFSLESHLFIRRMIFPPIPVLHQQFSLSIHQRTFPILLVISLLKKGHLRYTANFFHLLGYQYIEKCSPIYLVLQSPKKNILLPAPYPTPYSTLITLTPYTHPSPITQTHHRDPYTHHSDPSFPGSPVNNQRVISPAHILTRSHIGCP